MIWKSLDLDFWLDTVLAKHKISIRKTWQLHVQGTGNQYQGGYLYMKSKYEENIPDTHFNENGFVQLVRIAEPSRHKKGNFGMNEVTKQCHYLTGQQTIPSQFNNTCSTNKNDECLHQIICNHTGNVKLCYFFHGPFHFLLTYPKQRNLVFCIPFNYFYDVFLLTREVSIRVHSLI